MKIRNLLNAHSIPKENVYVSRSGGKGYHVETFFNEIVSTEALRALYQHIILEGQFDTQKVEFRPEYGRAVKLPLSIHPMTRNDCGFVNPVTFEPIIENDYFLQIQQNHVSDVIEALTLSHIATEKKPTKEKDKHAESLTETKGRCNGVEPILTAQGTRHNTMRRIAVFQRIHSATEEECRSFLKKWYASQDKSLISSDASKVYRDIDDLVSWVFSNDFVVPNPFHQKYKTVLSTRQLEKILTLRTSSERKVAFFLLLRYTMGQPRISAKNISEVIDTSYRTVNGAINKLKNADIIIVNAEKRYYQPNVGFFAEGRCYSFRNAWSKVKGERIEITMKDLVFDFNATYFRALQT